MKDHYMTLGLRKLAKSGEIKIAYQKLAAKYHPDRNPDPGSAEQFIAVKLAYKILSDGESRMAYDSSISSSLLNDPKQSAKQIWDTYLIFSKDRAVCDNESFLHHSKLGISRNEGKLTVYDNRSYFERALSYGVRRGILNQQKLEVISTQATDAILQLAQYFGTPYLWPELERAHDRLINLVSLGLESCARANLRQAAEMIRDRDLRSHSRAGAETVRRMLKLPQHTIFGMSDLNTEVKTDFAKWTLRPLAVVEVEYSMRMQAAQTIQAAVYFADKLCTGETYLKNACAEAEAVIRTSLMTLAYGRNRMPDLATLSEIAVDLGRRSTLSEDLCLALPKGMPDSLQFVTQSLLNAMISDITKLSKSKNPQRMLQKSKNYMGRYFWVEGTSVNPWNSY